MNAFQSPPLRHLIVAVQFMTRLPTPTIDTYRDDDMTQAANWIPAAGLMIGVALAAAYGLALLAGPLVAALAALLAWIWVTGALHLDGLADSADGLAAAHRGPERFLAAARDPYVGAFGVIAIGVALITKTMVLAADAVSAAAMIAALILIPALARLVAAITTHALPTLAPGRGASFKAGLDTTALTFWAVLLGAVAVLLVPAAAIAALIAGTGAVWYWRTAIGGMTGDTIGATIEAAECMMLVAVLAVPVSPALIWLASE